MNANCILTFQQMVALALLSVQIELGVARPHLVDRPGRECSGDNPNGKDREVRFHATSRILPSLFLNMP